MGLPLCCRELSAAAAVTVFPASVVYPPTMAEILENNFWGNITI